jgi:hypothetical protein
MMRPTLVDRISHLVDAGEQFGREQDLIRQDVIMDFPKLTPS